MSSAFQKTDSYIFQVNKFIITYLKAASKFFKYKNITCKNTFDEVIKLEKPSHEVVPTTLLLICSFQLA